MAYNFIECNRDQAYLMPPSLLEWLAQGDLVWFILDAVDQMDLTAFYQVYRSDGKGQASYEPSMMVALLLYAYCIGVRSSRQMERLCERDIAFRVIAANQVPDHSTIARFRQEHGKRLEQLFTDVLVLCAEAGLVKVGVVALDGTKIKANAALEANRTYEHIEREVKKMLTEAEAKDVEEDRLFGKDQRGDELPEGLRDRTSRLARLKTCKERLERGAAQEAARQQEKIEQREVQEVKSGCKMRGRKPKAPDPGPDSQAKANVTDPDSRIMKTRRGYVQGYNAQAVATEEQVIIAAELTTQENDVNQLHPMVEKAQENMAALQGKEQGIGVVLVDAGYCSEKNLAEIDPEGPEHLMAIQKDHKQRQAMSAAGYPRGRIPKGMTQRERMERKLLTQRGRALYKRRGQIIEPVFGQIKVCRGIERFMRRGVEACAQEWKLMCATHNLLKLWRSGWEIALQTVA